VTTGRQSDTSPFYGGGRYYPSGCTTSFGVRNPTTGREYLVSAAHCDGATGIWTYTASEGVGYTRWVGWNDRIDAELIETDAGPYIFDGAWNDANGYRKPVAGYANTVVGQWVCVSGSYSGTVCSGKVVDRGRSYTADGHSVVGDWIEKQGGGVGLGGGGDSGSPTFTVTPADNYARMTVVGTQSAGDTGSTVPCQGVQGRTSYSRLLIARFNNLKIVANVVPLTATG
jgi:hypothetical protein